MGKHLAITLGLLLAGACNSSSDTTSADTGSQGTGGKSGGSAGMSASGGGAGMSSSGGAGMGSSTSGGAGSGASADKDIVDTAVAAGSFKKLADALTKAGLVDALKGAGPFTVFAPTDDAFAAFEQKNPGVLAGLSKDDLGNVLKYHVIAGAAVKSSELKNGGVAQTLAGPPVIFDLSAGAKIDDAKITMADIVAKNGVIHVIDQVILPPKDDIVATAVAAGSFTKLAKALTDAGLVSALQAEGPFTVFAPTDDAFGMLSSVPTGDALKNVLLYHVVKGAIGSGNLAAGKVDTLLDGKSLTVDLAAGVKINDAKVTKSNILTKNGVIHVVDKVLVPN